jgi:hypothetical protein
MFYLSYTHTLLQLCSCQRLLLICMQSHPHWDHVGRPSLLPPSTTLMTGPGVKEAFYPGYPEHPTSPILSRQFAGRTVMELDFSSSDLVLSGFQAIDYFGDGSLYFLSTPGHAIGHTTALARTTATSNDNAKADSSLSRSSSSTFILMAADSYHHASMIRPHKHSPLPNTIPDHVLTTGAALEMTASQCLGEVYKTIHPAAESRKPHIPAQYTSCMEEHHSEPKTTPFFTISQKPTGETVAVDIDQAKSTIRGLQESDGDPNILLIAAHDASIAPVLSYFPRRRINGSNKAGRIWLAGDSWLTCGRPWSLRGRNDCWKTRSMMGTPIQMPKTQTSRAMPIIQESIQVPASFPGNFDKCHDRSTDDTERAPGLCFLPMLLQYARMCIDG